MRAIADQLYNENPNIFNNVACIHFIFVGIIKCEFLKDLLTNQCSGGTIADNFSLKSTDGNTTYWTGPVTLQRDMGAILHERLHVIGEISGYPNGFVGFPDRGIDRTPGEGYHNTNVPYDIMYHQGDKLPPLHSLYGEIPLCSPDLIFLGWIRPDEIETINSSNFNNYSDIKLADWSNPLTQAQINEGYRRIIKVMIHENYGGTGYDEYFLVEYHNASGLDKAFENYAEYPLTGYNKGVLIWHIKEETNMINRNSDNIMRVVAAVPYNGWYNNPIPADPYRTDYTRQTNYNGVHSGEYEYLDDALKNPQTDKYYFMQDGGQHIWGTTVVNDLSNTFGWDPTGQRLFWRLESLSSDFFSDQSIKGHVTDELTDAGRPTTKDWGGVVNGVPFANKTHIAVTDITSHTGFMTVRVYYNYWTGTYTNDQTMSGNVIIGGDVTIPTGVTLTIQPGTILKFMSNANLTINGILDAEGSINNKITFDRNGTSGYWGYIKFDGSSASNSILNNVVVKNSSGIQCLNGASITIQNSAITGCNSGIYIYNSGPKIISNNITDTYGSGIYGSTFGWTVLMQGNSIKKVTNNLHNYEGIYLNNSPGVSHITANDIQGFDYGIYFGGGGEAFFYDDNYVTPSINNRFTNNRTGICASYGSFMAAGISQNWCGNNSIYGNSDFDAKAYENGDINAQYNWWGTDGAQIYTTSGGTVDASNPLSSDPWGGVGLGGGGTASPVVQNIQNDDPNGEDSILQCISLEIQHRIPEAVLLCKQMLYNNSHPKFALTQLVKFKYKYNIIIKDYLDSLLLGSRPFKAIVLHCLAGIALRGGHYNISIGLFNRIINEFPNSREAVNALFEKFFAALLYKKNKVLAGQFLSQLQSLSLTDEDFLMSLDMAEELYNGGGTGGNQPEKLNGTNNSNNNLLKEYSLLDNYPNPFNPSTTITYELPKAGFVTLKVYDLLGKEVATLVNEFKNAGRYNITFNAANLASGMYFYRFKSGSYISTKKMLLLK